MKCVDLTLRRLPHGSIYIGDQKITAEHPRLRGPAGEIPLKSYQKLKEPARFSEELLNKVLRGISCRKYAETVVEAAQSFGVSAGSVSRHIVEATAKELQKFKERSLSEIIPFAIFLDTIHRGGEAFIVGLGINTAGIKTVLGFWHGTEGLTTLQESHLDYGWGERNYKDIKRSIGQETYSPALRYPQRPEHSVAPGEAVSKGGSSPLQDCS